MLKMDFEWDPRKAAANLAKHGVDFEIAIEVFLDGAALLEPDDSEPGEERWRIIGLAQGRVLFVVFTERGGDVKRIISARKATRREEREYFGQAAS
jgi:uncharacterized DUF497 family protein